MRDQRSLPFQGAVNFRDLGGYQAGPSRRTRWRTVFRSDSLAELTDEDLARFEALNLYGVCDFRLPDEASRKPDRLPQKHDLKLLNPGFLPEKTEDMLRDLGRGGLTADDITAEVTHHYRLFAQRHVVNYIPWFRLLLEADGRPVLIHCTSGKDRTGWGAALTLLAAGCDDSSVAADYILTNDYRRDVSFMFPKGADAGLLQTLTSAQPVYIETALSELRRIHGDGDGWMELLDLDASERAQLRRVLTEPTA